MPLEIARPALFLVYAIVSVAGMVLLKSAGSLFSLRGLVGFALYVLGFVIWTGIILKMMPLSQAFPAAAGTLLVGTQLAGWLLFNERIGTAQCAGIILILGGVILVSTTPQSPT